MRVITIFRAMAWFGVIVVFWSLNIRWGTDVNLPNGPPRPWHTTVVGAGLLAFIAALALSVSGRGGKAPHWIARAIAGLAAAGILFIAWSLYREAHSGAIGNDVDAVAGTGWTWLLAGGGMVSSAAIGALGLQTEGKDRDKGKSKGKRGKRR
jgi:hypothetical protein